MWVTDKLVSGELPSQEGGFCGGEKRIPKIIGLKYRSDCRFPVKHCPDSGTGTGHRLERPCLSSISVGILIALHSAAERKSKRRTFESTLMKNHWGYLQRLKGHAPYRVETHGA
jgi:hypothetical protein